MTREELTREELAGRIDYALVLPQLTDEQVVEGLQRVRQYGLPRVTVRPCDIDLAVRTLQGSSVQPNSVCAFPHGSQNTATKLYEARDLLRRGAKGIEMVIGVSKLLSREFQHVQTELLQMAEACHKEGATLTVMLETAYLTEELKIIACRCAERAEADFVATSIMEDIRLLRKYVPEEVGVKAWSIGTLDQALAAIDGGAGRIECPLELLDACQKPPVE